MTRLELVGVGNDIGKARDVASALKGRLLFDERDSAKNLPFRALVSAVTDDVETLLEASDVGAYVVCRRVMKPRAEAHSPGTLNGAIGLFALVHHPELSHRQSDDHWRDNHTPLALQHHPMMTHYTQLAVLDRLHGPQWDGFALCGFASVEDLRERFYGSAEGKVAIRRDVALFANTEKSPRRLIATEASWEQGEW